MKGEGENYGKLLKRKKMLIIKRTAKLNGLRPEMTPVLIIANEAYSKHGLDCVVTEGTGSKHGRASLHYVGLAIDFRMNNIPKRYRGRMRNDRKARLGNQYDVVLEEYPNRQAWDHLHTEYQPK